MAEKTPIQELVGSQPSDLVVDAYDSRHGKYEGKKPALSPVKLSDPPQGKPFRLGGEK